MSSTATAPDRAKPGVAPEAALANPQGAAAATLAATTYGWDGEELPDLGGGYEDYLDSRPAPEERRPFAEPVLYWAPVYPGASLAPYPRLGEIRSSPEGLWTAHNAAQDQAIRSHLRKTTKVDPESLKLSPQEWAVMQGKADNPPVRFCHDPGCRWVSCSPLANAIHERERGHTTKATPRER